MNKTKTKVFIKTIVRLTICVIILLFVLDAISTLSGEEPIGYYNVLKSGSFVFVREFQ